MNPNLGVTTTMTERPYKNNEMKCNFFVLVVILNIKLYVCLSDVLLFSINLLFINVIFKLSSDYIN